MTDFNKLIERHLSRDLSSKGEGEYYPFEISGCMRKIWYSCKDPIQPDSGRLKIFQIGSLIHGFIADVIASDRNPEAELIDRQVDIGLENNGIRISGRVSELIVARLNGKKVLVSVKSTKWLEGTRSPNRVHRDQLQLYMHALSIPVGIMVYVEKNTLSVKSFSVQYMPEVALRLLSRFRQLDRLIQSGKIPPAEAKQEESLRWQCAYCDYRERCDIAEHNSEVQKE